MPNQFLAQYIVSLFLLIVAIWAWFAPYKYNPFRFRPYGAIGPYLDKKVPQKIKDNMSKGFAILFLIAGLVVASLAWLQIPVPLN